MYNQNLINMLPENIVGHNHNAPSNRGVSYQSSPSTQGSDDYNSSNNGKKNNAITLTYNGVDFRLIPTTSCQGSSMGSGVSLLPDAQGQFTILNLTSFTGTLYVSASKSSPKASLPVSTSVSPTQLGTNQDGGRFATPFSATPPPRIHHHSSITPSHNADNSYYHHQNSLGSKNNEQQSLSMSSSVQVVDEEDNDSPTPSSFTNMRGDFGDVHVPSLPSFVPPGQQQLSFEKKTTPKHQKKRGRPLGKKNKTVKKSRDDSKQEIQQVQPVPAPALTPQIPLPSIATPTPSKTMKPKEVNTERLQANENSVEQQTRASTPTLGQSTQIMSSQSPFHGTESDEIAFNSTTVSTPPPSSSKPILKNAPSASIQAIVQRSEIADDEDEKSISTVPMTGDNNTIMEFDDDDDNDSQAESDKANSETKKSFTNKDVTSTKSPEAVETIAAKSTSLAITKVNECLPCPRWGHTMTLIDNCRLMVYGGQTYNAEEEKLKTLSDLHVYDMNKRTWTKPINCEGVPRTWHSATFLPDRQLLISFGGESYNPKTKKTTTTDQVMVLDTEIMLWYPPSVSGAVPTGRSGHTASLLPNTKELVVFGGVKNNKWQNSIAVLDTTRWKWSVPKVSGHAPRARSYHTATPVTRQGKGGSLLVIFGGNNDTKAFNTVHVLDASDVENKGWSWSHPTVSGTAPSPRTGHCATLLEDGKTIMIYGGWDPNDDDDDEDDDKEDSDEDMIYGDSFLLDTESWSWSSGPKPKFVGGQAGVQNGGKKRTGHKSVLAPGEDGTQVLVFGGRIPQDKFACDFQNLVIPKKMVSLRNPNGAQ